MGLDMYLEKEYYVGGHYDYCKVEGVVKLTINTGTDRETTLELSPKEIGSINSQAGYWRKANQIHNFFVEKVQDGKDECQRSYVPKSVLTELRSHCKTIIDARNAWGMEHDKTLGLVAKLLPPSAGFFFGSTGVDQWYFQDLESTIEIIDKISPDDDCSYYYQASW